MSLFIHLDLLWPSVGGIKYLENKQVLASNYYDNNNNQVLACVLVLGLLSVTYLQALACVKVSKLLQVLDSTDGPTAA
jgi:hypothetical protein